MKKTPLRRTAWVRKPKPRADGDRVTPDMHARIIARYGRCMAPVLDRELDSPCRDNFGNALDFSRYSDVMKLELDHVWDEGKTTMRDRAPSDDSHLIALCPYHHKHSGWATSKRGRALEREHLGIANAS